MEGNAFFGAVALRRLRQRAEQAFAEGHASFAMPEAAVVVARLATLAPDAALREEAQAWLGAGASYHALVRLASRTLLACNAGTDPADAVYVPKVQAELEHMLRLWPAVLALPTTQDFTPLQLVALRAFPVHPLNVVPGVAWADGRACSPAEFFFHDLDHARYKIREDLALEHIDIPDAYVAGNTFDACLGQHRSMLDAAAGRIGTLLWERADRRAALADRLISVVASLDGARAEAAALLLFEVIHEKSYPLDAEVLLRELAGPAHADKIRYKQVSGFYGTHAPSAAALAAIGAAQEALRDALSAARRAAP